MKRKYKQKYNSLSYHWLFAHRRRNSFASFPKEKTRSTFLKTLNSLVHIMFTKQTKYQEELRIWESQDIFNPIDFLNQHDAHVTWIGHATFLIRMGQTTILTDPIFDNISYILTLKRLTKPGISLTELPKIDIILLSHNHRDHMDENALKFLRQRDNPLFLVPHGDKAWFDRRCFERVTEFNWWDSHSTELTTCTFLPGVHWSQRSVLDHNKSLWGGWMLKEHTTNSHVFFSGDSAYGSHFKAIANAYPHIDTALMPIGPTEPHKLMHCSHMTPEQAGQAFLDLNAQALVPMHWGTYCLGTEHPLDPIQRLAKWWYANKQKVKTKQLWLSRFGQRLALSPRSAFAQTHLGLTIDSRTLLRD